MRILPPDNAGSSPSRWPSSQPLRLVLFLIAIAYAVPVATSAYDRLMRVNQAAKERLIREHRLWELQPDFRGKPEIWARMASRLLNDRQLLARVAVRYGAHAEPLELEYRRDLGIARAEVVFGACALWTGPLAAIYGIAWALRRRKHMPPQKLQPASTSDPRYLPPDAG